MTEKKSFLVGNARLSDLNGFEDVNKNGVRGCFIPYDQNPSIFVGANKQTGALVVDLDILIRETRNQKTESTHFIKLSVRKANRERFQMSQEAVDSLKIIGNCFTRMPLQQGQQNQGGYPQQGGYQRPPAQGQAAPHYPQTAYPQQGFAPSQGGFQQAGSDGLPAGW